MILYLTVIKNHSLIYERALSLDQEHCGRTALQNTPDARKEGPQPTLYPVYIPSDFYRHQLHAIFGIRQKAGLLNLKISFQCVTNFTLRDTEFGASYKSA
jgi:hypothetical protein